MKKQAAKWVAKKFGKAARASLTRKSKSTTGRSKRATSSIEGRELSPMKIGGALLFLGALFPDIALEGYSYVVEGVETADARRQGRAIAYDATGTAFRAKIDATLKETRAITSAFKANGSHGRTPKVPIGPDLPGVFDSFKVSEKQRQAGFRVASLAALGGVEIARKASLALFAIDVLNGVVTGDSRSGRGIGDTFTDILKLYSVGAASEGLRS